MGAAWQERCPQHPAQAVQTLLAAASLEAGSKAARPARVTVLARTTKQGQRSTKGPAMETEAGCHTGTKAAGKERGQDRLSSVGGGCHPQDPDVTYLRIWTNHV